jgi:hypothetical protein
MGVDLLNVHGHGSEGFNHAGWRAVLELAIKYGWQPEGTAPPMTMAEFGTEIISATIFSK